MPRVPRLTQEQVRSLLDYDPITGVFIWRRRDLVLDYGWNAKNAGKVAGSLMTIGYLMIRINRKPEYCHRLAFLWMTGSIPAIVDHINLIKTDNRWGNLRGVSKSQNMSNAPRPTRNTSGFKGVWWHAQRGKWSAEFKSDNQRFRLGLFATKEEAAAAYAAAVEKRFGRFARTE